MAEEQAAVEVVEREGKQYVIPPEHDGVFEGVPMPHYVAMPLLSSGSPGKLHRGTLKVVKQSVGDGELGTGDDGGDSSARTLGNVVHAAILEPDTFKSQFMALPFADPEKFRTGSGAVATNPKATKDYKDAVAAQKAEHPDVEHIDESEFAKAMTMQNHVFQHEEGRALLKAEGLVEGTVVVTDPEFGLRWKLRPDKVIHSVAANLSVKTARNARPDIFAHDFFRFQYHIKEAIYRMLLPEAGLAVKHSWMLVLENEGAHETVLFNLSADPGGVLDLGRELALHYMRKIADAADADAWPGSPQTIIDLQAPDYIYDRVAEELVPS